MSKHPHHPSSTVDNVVEFTLNSSPVLVKESYLFNFLMKHSSDFIFAKDLTGRFLRISRGLADFFGLSSPDEVIGKTDFDFYPADYAEEAHRTEQEIINTAASLVDVEETVTWDDGRVTWFSTTKMPLFDTEEHVIGIMGIIRDITARKAIEAKLRREEYLLNALLDNSPDVIYYKDLESRFLRISASLAHLYGLSSPEEGIGKSDFDFFPVEEADKFFADEQQIIRTEEPIVNIEEQASFAKADTQLWISTTKMPLRDQDGKVVGTFGVGRDITSLTLTKEELMRSNAELQQFAYVASHDLQEPLRMVASYVQLLARRYQGKLDEDADEFIGYAVDGANRMKDLINALLTYSRVGTQGKQLTPTNVEHVLRLVISNLQLAIEDSNAEVTYDPLPTVLADDTQLGQLFQNLIGNGLKFHGDLPPRIHITAEPQGAFWRFSVKDNGIGFESQYAEQIFSMFRRLHAHSEYRGTGIGLAVCKKIVERHYGHIWAESSPGQGSTFIFTLPKMRKRATDV